MSVNINDVKKSYIKEEEGTNGGTTYYVRLPNSKVSDALCFRAIHKQPELRCTNHAGAGTWHLGTGPCKFHGGNAGGEKGNLKTGKTAFVTRGRLGAAIQEYLSQDRSKLLDMTEQLAATKAIYDEFINNVPEYDDEKWGIFLSRFQNIVRSMNELVNGISVIDNRNTLTAAQVLYLRATVADILMKYITDPSIRDRAARELANRMGGDMEVELQPREVKMLN